MSGPSWWDYVILLTIWHIPALKYLGHLHKDGLKLGRSSSIPKRHFFHDFRDWCFEIREKVHLFQISGISTAVMVHSNAQSDVIHDLCHRKLKVWPAWRWCVTVLRDFRTCVTGAPHIGYSEHQSDSVFTQSHSLPFVKLDRRYIEPRPFTCDLNALRMKRVHFEYS